MGDTATVNGVSGDRLKSIIERVEHLTEEKKALQEDIKEVLAEAKGAGYDTKIIKAIIKRRALDPDERKESELLLDIYLEALGEKPDM